MQGLRDARDGHSEPDAYESDESNKVRRTNESLRQYLAQWIEEERREIGRKLKASSWRTEKLHVEKYISPGLGDCLMANLDAPKVEALYDSLERAGSVRSGKPLKQKTVANIHLTLHKALGAAVKSGMLDENPASGAYSPPYHRQVPDAWTSDEPGLFLSHASDDRQHALWRLAAMSGMRRGELIGLRWHDVDWEHNTVSISQARIRGQTGIDTTTPKSERGKRTVDLDERTVDSLRQWKRVQAEERMRLASPWPDHGLVFTRPDGRGLDPDVVSQQFKRLVRDSGLRAITLHSVRHTHATLLLKGGTPAHVVPRRLGHGSEAFTLKQYAHVLPQQQSQAVEVLAAMVDAEHSTSVRHQRGAS